MLICFQCVLFKYAHPHIYLILILLLIHAIPLALVNVFYNVRVILLILSLFLHA